MDNNKKNTTEYETFEEAFSDGRLAEPWNGKTIRLRDAIKRVEELGRPLTEEEMAEFEYDS